MAATAAASRPNGKQSKRTSNPPPHSSAPEFNRHPNREELPPSTRRTPRIRNQFGPKNHPPLASPLPVCGHRRRCSKRCQIRTDPPVPKACNSFPAQAPSDRLQSGSDIQPEAQAAKSGAPPLPQDWQSVGCAQQDGFRPHQTWLLSPNLRQR